MARFLRRSLFALGLASCLVGCTRRTSPPSPSAAATDAAASADAPGRCLEAEQTLKYTALFVASEAQVKTIFVGWRPPQARHPKVQRNPFTGKDETMMSEEPDDTGPSPAARSWDLHAADIPGDAGYDGYLASRVPAEIRRLPHRPMKRVLLELSALVEGLGGKSALPAALFPPSGCKTSFPLMRVPDSTIAELRKTSGDSVAKLAARLKTNDAFEDWKADEIATFVDSVASLARSAAPGDGLYVLSV